MFQFDGPNKLIYLQYPNTTFDAIHLYSDWKRWVLEAEENAKYEQAMRSIGGDAISATKYIAGYIELLNGWRIKPYAGDYVLTVVGNLFATGGETPFIGADSGTVLVSMETTGNALALQTTDNNTTDILAPVWSSSVGIIDAYQSGDQINIRWGLAVDTSNAVSYNVYISETSSSLWSFKLGTFDGTLLNIGTEFDGVTELRGITYYIGVRAIDKFGNETDNVNMATINYIEPNVINDVNIISVNSVPTSSIEDFKGLNDTQNTTLNEISLLLNDIKPKIDTLLDVELGNWKIENNQMIFYAIAGTELARFNLLDENGNPSTESTFERQKV